MDFKKHKFLYFLDKHFHITERQSNVKSEVIGGLVNFLVIVYVMIVIPNILTGGVGGTDFWKAIFLSTIISVIVTSFAMGFYANLPLISAPGIGLSSYFAVLIADGTYTYSQTITIAFISGCVYIFLTLIGFRKKLVEGMPSVMVNAIPAGIGLFIASIGLNSSNSGLLDFLTYGPTYLVNGQAVWISALISVIGFLIIITLHHYKVKGSIFIGIIGSTILSIILQFCLGNNPFASLNGASWLPPFTELFNNTFANFDFAGLFTSNSAPIWSTILSAVLIIFSYTMVDLFDTVGTLYGATKNTSLMDSNGKITNMNRAFWVDSISTVWGAVFGVPGCTVYVESTAGIKSGSRTGLSSVIVGILFILTMFFSPIVMLIPASATAPALIFVGLIMFESALQIDFTKITNFVPSVFTILIMPLTGNISYGIGAGLILYVLTMLFTKQGKKVSAITYVLAILFLIFFITQNIF